MHISIQWPQPKDTGPESIARNIPCGFTEHTQ